MSELSRTDWANKITVAWHRSRDDILEVGRYLIEAKSQLAHGEFEAMVSSDLPFNKNTAHRLRAIAEDSRLSNVAHAPLLPNSWGTLYELTKLDNDQFERAVADKAINPDMQRNDVARIRAGGWQPDAPPDFETCTVDDLKALAGNGVKFGAIVADPPWSFKVYSGKGKARSAERHYQTLSLDDIKALPIADLAADDCALFLWSVWPQIPEALEVISAWGFTYKTCGFCFVKQNESGQGFFTGMGYWTRANTEPCLLAVRGAPKRQHMDVPQLVVHPVMEHSRKPGLVHERIERLVPGPYLELFGRRITPGWTVWGNQIERRLFDGEVKEVA